ncbi:hypothetical protein HXX76_006145 [Chlamydomonas incerta]|uniref:Thiaminase-2/PQQC domain-containing protein n=1 Tax=Chlamydomonas incerta TaxID=51695 RepID=A0A835TFU4_CHLIN|nr:hypothetical protein HXX76_006145 [Chlamydomonas incerta]|eukprot:KAG2437496.1 hypothetical protein HXX76_006145 [Chlamydomonas incerta]
MAPVTIASIKAGLPEGLWAKATSHPFLDAIADRTIHPAQFNTWLVQDYFYVRSFVRLTAATMLAAPDGHLDVLVGGMAALQAELAWFKAKAAERGLTLEGTALQPAAAAYIEWVQQLFDGAAAAAAGADNGAGAGKAAPYAVLAVVFWAIEACYNTAWGSLRGRVAPEYDEFVERWGSKEFVQYVVDLAAQADEALAAVPAEQADAVAAAAAAAVARVAELEVGFWAMAFFADTK